jgi:hypothetical protein
VPQHVPRKSLPEFIGAHSLGILSASENWAHSDLDTVTTGDVKNIKTPKAGSVVLAAWLICLCPQLLKAGGEPLPPAESPSEQSESTGSNLGVGKFSPFPFHLSATLNEGFDDNVNTGGAGNEQSSLFTQGGLDLTYAFGSPRAQLNLSAGGAITYYNERTGIGTQNYDIDFHARFRLNFVVTPRLLLNFDLHAAYQTEPDFTSGIGFYTRSGNYFYTDNTGVLTYLWTPRFSTATSATIVDIKYDSAAVGMVEDRFDNTFGNAFRFLLWPTTTIVADYRFETINFTRTTTSANDSTTHFLLGGFDHTFSPRLNVSIRAGEEFRFFQDGTQKSGPYAEGDLNYAAGKRTTISWTNTYALQEPNQTTNPIETAFRTSLQASHQLTPKITATLSLGYEHDQYEAVTEQFFGFTFTVSPAFADDDIFIHFSLNYAITPYFGVQAGYDRTEIMSDLAFRQYTRNRFYGGVNFAF